MDRPNVFVITTDHWPAALLGSAGHALIQTPTLDELARCGTRFTNAYSECPVCIPARRTLMTGMNPRTHGDRTFQTTLRMPSAPTLAGTFRDAGYQTYAVGKLHVYPQRDRIGFDDVWLAEEGRPQWGVWDDYDIYLGEEGYVGRQFEHGMSNNQYIARPWHLPEETHVTNWSSRMMSKMIRRRDPNRPGFWYLSFTHPHPPLVPPQHYWNLYQQLDPGQPEFGDWVPAARRNGPRGGTEDDRRLPWLLRSIQDKWHVRRPDEYRTALRAFFALCTHIDHQIRFVLGTLREEGVLDNTIILFSADHGEMLGQHGLWAKRLYYEGSANVPMLLVGPKGGERVPAGRTDSRLTGLQDMFPTLVDLAGLPCPDSCDGISMVGTEQREHLYGECNEGSTATRMVHDGRFKLIYYASGNHCQLFDLKRDPRELNDLSGVVSAKGEQQRLQRILISELYGSDLDWLDASGTLIGLPDAGETSAGERGLFLQRGTHWPPAPIVQPEE